MRDIEYNIIVDDILKNDIFNKINDIEHHGTTRMTHSKRVSYYSYKICKLLHLDYISAARAGLLHDFFISDNNRNKKERLKSTFIHPKEALKNANKYFDLNPKEQDIIITHMFPININIPLYMESWIVSTIDKIVGTFEFIKAFSLKYTYITNLYLALITFFR